jgi:tetratricopeptide (TPR) repeat protein
MQMSKATPSFPEAMKRAVAAYEHGRLGEADDLARAILGVRPDYFDALHLIAVISTQQRRLDEALASYDRALALQPDHAGALFNRGIALHELKRFEEALASYDRALALQPDHAGALYNRGITLQGLKRFDEALASYDRALALQPDNTGALCNRGNALRQLKRLDEALASYERALALQPDHVMALYNRGNTLHALKRFGEALASYDRALALQPDYADALNNRGNALHELKRFDEALASYDRALAVRPDHAGALYNRGMTLHEIKRFAEALASYDRALALLPDNAEALCNRGNTLHELQRFDEALASYDRALALQPNNAGALYNRGNTLRERGDLHAALAHYRRALSLKPDLAEVYNNMGNVLKELGQFQGAQSAYLEALRLDPNSTTAYVNLAVAKTFKPGDAHLAAMEALAAKSEGLSKTDRMQLDFALGKAYADLNDHSRSFQHLLAGNAAKRASICYDETAALGRFDRIEAVFTPELIAAKSGGGNPSALPIFVLGMPRSGTTLVEQIIASHPLVHGAGELQAFNDVVLNVCGPDGSTIPYPEFMAGIDDAALKQIGARYVNRVRGSVDKDGARSKQYVTDKMPSNYYFAGLIHLALPNAKIIHTVRDALDTCVSCFSILFSVEQNHTYDLGELGRYYKRYERLMAHWRKVLPASHFLDVSYEAVVADLEIQARRIIAHCGLPWDDRCLAFHKTDRPVRTASATQVRQPIYKTAVGRWRTCEQYLGPLLSALERGAQTKFPSPPK